MIAGPAMLLVSLGVLACSFVVTLAESAFLSVSLVRLNDLKASDKRAARVMLLLAEKPKVVTSLIFVDILSDVLLTLIIGSTLFNAGLVGFAVGAIIASVLIAVCSTLIPMAIGMAVPLPIALSMSYGVFVVSKVVSPLLAPLVRAVDEFGKVLGKNPQTAADELVSYLGILVDNGRLNSESAVFVEQAIRASGLSAYDIATSVGDGETLSTVATVRDALVKMGAVQRARLVVVDGSPSGIVGIVSFKSISKAVAEGKFDSPVSECTFTPPIVERKDKLDSVFKRMVDAGVTAALIKDGDYIGVIGVNDITESALMKA
ncbi:MAG: DUF21 domain-containing protein [Nitrososphaerota archaeon]|nr:DUF21 domain-containing protein [Nitrososphaerota archaeon]